MKPVVLALLIFAQAVLPVYAGRRVVPGKHAQAAYARAMHEAHQEGRVRVAVSGRGPRQLFTIAGTGANRLVRVDTNIKGGVRLTRFFHNGEHVKTSIKSRMGLKVQPPSARANKGKPSVREFIRAHDRARRAREQTREAERRLAQETARPKNAKQHLTHWVRHQARRVLNPEILRPAIMGFADGLTSTFIFVIASAGEIASGTFTLWLFVRVAISGALSMGAGEIVSVAGANEQALARKKALVSALTRRDKKAFREHLALAGEIGDVTADRQHEIARLLWRAPGDLDRFTHELKLDDQGSPHKAGVSSSLSFLAGASVPLMPFALGLPGQMTTLASGTASAVALVAAGTYMAQLAGVKSWRARFRLAGWSLAGAALSWVIAGAN